MIKGVEVVVVGKVQGVGFRYYTLQKALVLGLVGFVTNRPDGSVFVVAQGEESRVIDLVDWLEEGSPASEVQVVMEQKVESLHSLAYIDFRIKR